MFGARVGYTVAALLIAVAARTGASGADAAVGTDDPPSRSSLREAGRSSGKTPADPYAGMKAYVGDIHVHTGLAIYRVLTPENPHSIGTVDQVLDVAQSRGLDFVVITDHTNNLNDPRGVKWREESGETFTLPDGTRTASEWVYLQSAIARWNRPGRFVTLLGLEYTRGASETGSPGHQLGVFPSASLPRYCSNFEHNAGDCPTNTDFFRFVREQNGVAVMAHPCANWGPSDWGEYDPVVNAMELVAAKCEFTPDSGYNAVLKRGLRIGARGSSDSHHFEVGGNDKTICFARELTREAILDAMKANRCYYADQYAVTMRFSIDGAPMGSEVVDSGAGITVKAEVVTEWQTDLDHIELIHDGEVSVRADCSLPGYDSCSLTTYIPSGTAGYYYVAVSNGSGHRSAVSSPIWVRPPR